MSTSGGTRAPAAAPPTGAAWGRPRRAGPGAACRPRRPKRCTCTPCSGTGAPCCWARPVCLAPAAGPSPAPELRQATALRLDLPPTPARPFRLGFSGSSPNQPPPSRPHAELLTPLLLNPYRSRTPTRPTRLRNAHRSPQPSVVWLATQEVAVMPRLVMNGSPNRVKLVDTTALVRQRGPRIFWHERGGDRAQDRRSQTSGRR